MIAALAVTAMAALAAVAALHQSRRRIRRLTFTQRSEADLLAAHLAGQDVSMDTGAEVTGYLQDAVVMVIGAGGTIGAELALTLSGTGYRRLVVADNNENGLYALAHRLGQERPDVGDRLAVELLNVRDRLRLDQVFAQHRPDVVFHYANYKSAALGNTSAYGFVQVNLGGTLNVLNAVARAGSVQRMVYISSDKAHSATQTYGRTKRISELMVQVHAARHPRIRYASLRYCNVLDAAGSFAIPSFRDQIVRGRRITVRRFADGGVPDRYFITKQVAAGLAIQAGALAASGNVLSLDPNRIQPIRVDDLVRLLGHEYGIVKVDRWYGRSVQYVPVEDGEKRSEALGTGTPVAGAPLIQLPGSPVTDGQGLLDSVPDLQEMARHRPEELPGRLAELIARFDLPVSPEPVPAPEPEVSRAG